MPALTTSKPYTHFELDKPVRMRFDWSSCNRFEEAYGQSISSCLLNAENLGSKFLTVATWASLLASEPKLTIAETEKRIGVFLNNDGDIAELSKKIFESLMNSGIMGRPKPVDAPEEDVPADRA